MMKHLLTIRVQVLLNVDMKFIPKAMANLIKPVIPSLVSKNQIPYI